MMSIPGELYIYSERKRRRTYLHGSYCILVSGILHINIPSEVSDMVETTLEHLNITRCEKLFNYILVEALRKRLRKVKVCVVKNPDRVYFGVR